MSPPSPLRTLILRVCALCAIGLPFAAALSAQTETTASLGGAIAAGDTRAAVAGARITLRHIATGDVFATRSNKAGQYLFTGLRPGEFHAMRVTAPGYDAWEFPDIILALGEERQLDVTLAEPASELVKLETFVVTAAREHSQPGVSTTIFRDEIESRPSIDQTINDYATADPRITMIDEETGAIVVAGQHHLFNSLQIDGIRLDDGFGLSDNGLPALGNPFAMETIQAVSVDIAPYDVSRGGFTGASINAVTKSGANHFFGSAYYNYENEKFRAKDPHAGTRTPYTNENYGFTLGGPILRNRLFFFINWERNKHTDPAPEARFVPSAAAIERIISIARDKYGFDAGALYDPGGRSRQSDRYMAKLDWRINASHRLSARYTISQGDQPVFPDYSRSDATSLNSHWYVMERNLNAWSAQLSSKWSDSFQTEASFARQNYTSDRTPYARLPQVRIAKVDAADGGDTGVLYLGAHYDSQVNFLSTKKTQAKFNATWLLGKHRLQFGAEYSRDDYDNKFLRYGWGHYTFASIDDFENEKFSGYTYNYTLDGTAPGIKWGYAVNTAFLQDAWRVARTLTLTAGVRFEYITMGEKPLRNPLVEETFGLRNDTTMDGTRSISPRISFTWTPARNRALQLRGGLGLFSGRTPGVWLANAFTYDGMSLIETSEMPGGLRLNTDVTSQIPGKNTGDIQTVVIMDKKLRMPSIMRGNLALDFKLPWQNTTATIEWLYSRADKSLVYRNLNFTEPRPGPDGRPLYGTWKITRDQNGSITKIERNAGSQYQDNDFEDVFYLTNAARHNDNSTASYLTFTLKRSLRNHWGATLAYTRGHATDVSPFTNSTASANFGNREGIDPNSDETGGSNNEVRDRIVAVFTTQFALIRKFNTTIQLLYDGRSGRPYSYVFRNDANGDGETRNDLFYVPAGRNDPKIYWASQADADLFFAYLATDPSLQRYAGRIVPRNSEHSSFRHRFDLRISQEIPFYRTLRAEVFCTIVNIANLLNSKWGKVNQYSYKDVAYGYYDSEVHLYRYTMTNSDGILTWPRTETLQSGPSRWRIQAGVKVKF